MTSNPAKLLTERLHKLIQLLEVEEVKLENYRNLVEDYIVNLDIVTSNLDFDDKDWKAKTQISQQGEKILRKVSFELSCRMGRDQDLIDDLHEAIELVEGL